MNELVYAFRAELWKYQGKAAWFFVTVPKAESDRIRFLQGAKRKGWGSVRVVAAIGKTRWKTSVFPDKSGCYVLPIKAAVRTAEKIKSGACVKVEIRPVFDA